MNLLITCVHGFVGTNLVQSLKQRHEIYGVDIVSPEKEGIVKTFSWNELDKIPETDTIIHLAGKAHDTKNKSEAKTYFDVNFGLTQTIFDYFMQSNAKQFIFFSSVKAAADSVEGGILTEDVIPQPVGPYGESKIAAENYIHSQLSTFNSQFSILNSQLSTKKSYILRPCMIHGPGNKGNLNLLYSIAGKGIPWPLGAFENKRSFTSIDNLTFIIDSIIEKNIESGIYNICDDEAISTNDLISLIAHGTNHHPKIRKINKKLITFLAKRGDRLHLPLNSERLQKLTENYLVSNQKIKNALKIDKLPVSAKQGFEKTIHSFINQ